MHLVQTQMVGAGAGDWTVDDFAIVGSPRIHQCQQHADCKLLILREVLRVVPLVPNRILQVIEICGVAWIILADLF